MALLSTRWLPVLVSTCLLVACQAPAEKKVDLPGVKVAKTVATADIYRQLRSENAQDRIAALQLLTRQPRRAQTAMSMVLALLADNRQVNISRYIGAGGFSVTTTSPAAMAARLLAKLEMWSALPLSLRLDDPNPVVRQYTIRALGIIANPEQASWLLSAMADSNPKVNEEAYLALIKQDAQVYIGLIAKLDMQHFSVQQKCLLIQLLGNSRDHDALPDLVKFAGDHNPVLRRASFVALAKFSHANLQKVILKGIEDDDRQVKEDALMLAPRNKSPQVMAAVFSQLTTEDEQMRHTLLEILPRLTDEKLSTIKDWQRWWQAYQTKQ